MTDDAGVVVRGPRRAHRGVRARGRFHRRRPGTVDGTAEIRGTPRRPFPPPGAAPGCATPFSEGGAREATSAGSRTSSPTSPLRRPGHVPAVTGAVMHPPRRSIRRCTRSNEGRVATVRPFGLFVRMNGFVRDGLVHCANVSDELTFRREDGDDAKVMAMEYFHPRDSEVFAKVVEIRRDGYSGDVKVGLSMKLVDQSSGEDLDPDHSRAKALLEGGFGGNGNGNGDGTVIATVIAGLCQTIHRRSTLRTEPWSKR